MEDCVFCEIIQKKSPAEFVYEDEEIIGIKTTKPEAPIHLLFIPKTHMEWKNDLDKDRTETFRKLISVAKKIAIDKDIFEACKIIFNIGKTGHISHIHLHLIGGWREEVPTRTDIGDV